MVTRGQQGPQQAVLGGEAGGEGETAPAAVQGGEVLLQSGTGGIGAAAVLVAAAQPADTVLLVSGYLVDGRHHRAGGLVGLLACVDGERFEMLVALVALIAHACRG